MAALEIKKNIKNLSFLVSVLLLYLLFLLGDSGAVLPGDQTTTVMGAIWNKLHGNWQMCSDSSYLVRMYRIWSDNSYLPVLMPFLCGLPSAMVYLDEVHTGNKKWILSRCSFRQYYSTKIVANAVSAVLVSVLAVALYYVTLFFFFEWVPFSHEEFPVVYFSITKVWVEDVSAFSVYVICGRLLKSLLYFFLYSVMSSSLCLWIAVWCREKYTVFGGAVFLSYLPCRIYDELVRKYVNGGIEVFGKAADIINPTFLYYAGRSGFYEDKEWLALGLTASIIAINYGIAVLRAGLQETFTDRKVIVLLVLLGFILDNGIRPLVSNAMEAGQPLGIFEGFIMCLNHWYYLVLFLVGFIFILTSVPRLDSDQLLLIYRTGKKSWLFGEILQIAVSAAIYVILLLAGCVITTAKYAYLGNVWSNYTIYYELEYKEMLSDKYHFVDQQVFKYFLPYQSVIHGVLLLILCMTLMGSIILYCSIIDKKLVGIILNVVLVFFVLIFYEYRTWIMWISPFCHAVLLLHNIFVYKRLSVPLSYSYLYLISLEGIMIVLSLRSLKNRMFY